MRLPDRVTGLFLVGLGAAAAYGGWLLPPVPGQPVGPQYFPAGDRHRASRCAGSRSRSGSAIPSKRKKSSFRSRAASRPPPTGKFYGLRALLPPALLLFYVVVADRLGFIITAALIVFVTSTALGAKWKLSLPLAVLAPIGIHLIFSKLLRVPLPAGLLPMPW